VTHGGSGWPGGPGITPRHRCTSSRSTSRRRYAPGPCGRKGTWWVMWVVVARADGPPAPARFCRPRSRVAATGARPRQNGAADRADRGSVG
jgi:hypothetical protein